MRRLDSGLVNNEISRNPYVWGALALCIGLLLVAVYVPFLADILRVTAPGVDDWLPIVGGSLVPLIVGQVYPAVQGQRQKQSARREVAEQP